MSWEKSSYTTAGAALLSESLSGGALTITRAVSGTGIVETDLSAETTVSGETHELTILAIDTVKDGEETARKVSIQITGAESTYIMHQIGVYGRLNDDAEVLLFIMQDERGIEVPASSVNADFEIEIAALIAISNKAKIEIALSPQMQALMKLVKAEIEKHNAAADAHAATITAAVSAAVKNLSESGEILNEEQVKALIKEQVDGGTGGGYYGSYKLTLAADGWKPARNEDDYENAGGMDYYQCIYDAELSDSTSELVPVGVVSPGSFYTTTKAGVLNGCETHDGFIRFFAQRIPEADIQATVTLFGKGGGSGETGSVSIGQGLKRDASGALTLKDDGLYVPTPEEVDISGKADKATGATTGNFAALDGEGNLTDSGKKPADFVVAEAGKRLMSDAEGEKLAGVSEGATKTAASSTNGNVNIDGKEVVVYTEPENVLHDEDVEDFSAEEIAALLADAD